MAMRYCRCGEPIWVEFTVAAKPKFYVDGTQVYHCPGCGDLLDEDDLLTEPELDPISPPSVEGIARDVLELARQREEQAQDLVAAIHSVWMEVGLAVAREMKRIREGERRESDE